MKKAILLVSLMAATYTLSAQSVKFGIRGGLNLATADRGNLPEGNETQNLTAFNGGLFANIGLGNWAVEPGLFYSRKGFKANSDFTRNIGGGSNEDVSINGNVKYNYLELPVNVLYNVKLTPGKVFFGGGPYAGYLMSANAKSTTTINGVKTTEPTTNYSIGNNAEDIKRMDFGVNALAGFAFNNGFQLSAGYGYGMSNVWHEDSNAKVKNRVFNVSVGFAL
ncbi:MAG: porin family protein [Bacteroidota bacterium]